MKSSFQIFIENTVLSLLSVIKIAVLSAFNIKLPYSAKKNQECVILGNGPSLNKSLQELEFKFPEKDLICVNYFAETPFYTTLKPPLYILNAPEMWLEDVDEDYYKKSDKLFTTIAEKTSWNLALLIPTPAKNYDRWKRKIATNSFIEVYYFNTTPIDGFDKFKKFCFEKNLGMPRPHNVLIPSIMLSINLSYKKIYLLGAEHSWLKEIWVNDSNEVLLTQKHFYDEGSAKALPMNKLGKGSRKLHEVLIKFVYAFQGYFELKSYAETHNIQILNATPESYIDAFDRVTSGAIKEISN